MHHEERVPVTRNDRGDGTLPWLDVEEVSGDVEEVFGRQHDEGGHVRVPELLADARQAVVIHAAAQISHPFTSEESNAAAVGGLRAARVDAVRFRVPQNLSSVGHAVGTRPTGERHVATNAYA
jgi:hypothetical protein